MLLFIRNNWSFCNCPISFEITVNFRKLKFNLVKFVYFLPTTIDLFGIHSLQARFIDKMESLSRYGVIRSMTWKFVPRMVSRLIVYKNFNFCCFHAKKCPLFCNCLISVGIDVK